MFEQAEVINKIQEIYPDIKKFGISVSLKKDKLIGAENYDLTLEKDRRKSHVRLALEEVQECMKGNRCSLISSELSKFIKQFVDESYAVPEAG